jgi:hypothetical protein
MKLLAMVTDPKSIGRYLARIGEPTDPPARSPSHGPPFWKSVVLRQKMLAGADLGAGRRRSDRQIHSARETASDPTQPELRRMAAP